MALGWNEIKERAVKFSKEWAGTFNEEADAKPFLIDFFNVFGISQRRVATFEHRVKKLGEFDGYIDMLWKGTMVIEMKSRGKSLDKAYSQANDYLHGLKQYELPRYILVSDFENFRLYDLEDGSQTNFQLKDFVKHVREFGFIAGYQKRTYKAEDPVNIEAAYLMGKQHDALKEAGYTGHELEKYLVRLLFCLFAEDTTIFETRIFQEYIETKTNEDGTDLGMHLAQLFQVLNTPPEKRQKTLDESLAAFPYVNGHLFEEQLSFASFNSHMRQTLLESCYLDWGKISPAIFGSLFQSVMDASQRRNLGAHYTSEKNILKVIKPLFLDKLWQEFEAVKSNTNKLKQFHRKIASLRFLDPACGCGNFLVITYREIRLLEFDILKELQKGQQVTNVANLMLCDVDRFYGIEYEEFPAQIAQVALWLIDHQMNMLISQEFGEYFVRLPLRKSAKIIQGNALRTDWDTMIEPLPWENETTTLQFDYILGNPPFIGKQLQTEAQKSDLAFIFNNVHGAGVLDYVTAWYIKAAQYLEKHNTDVSNLTAFQNLSGSATRVAFVSTNSIAQGEQVGILWNELFNRYKIKIHFAHRTFKWGNEAKANAAVHVVIIGFSNFDIPEKLIYEYEDIKGEPHEHKVKNINPYLVEGKDIFIAARKKSICDAPEMSYGSMANDGGNLLLSDDEKINLLSIEPNAQKVIRPFLGSQEFINGIIRWCIWLKDLQPNEYSNLKEVLSRVKMVRQYRLESSREVTRKLADYPAYFGEIRQPATDYLLIPGVSSENRKYIPIGFLTKDIIASDLARTIPYASLYTFGIVTSIMHMTWVKYVCGRMKSDYRYSNTIVYNNYPWPENPSEKQKETIEKAAQKVLDVREAFPNSSLADLYNPLTMPPALVKAHNELDKVVDLSYRPQPFINETKRIEFLFELYDKYTAGLFVVEKKKKKITK
ncbi:MAG: class I SAM-dependent DNA methyltransferase [Mariniphaga sp.]|nr:class I SAM-dependent DNA methyltransferase [Mariniphaga sp.]